MRWGYMILIYKYVGYRIKTRVCSLANVPHFSSSSVPHQSHGTWGVTQISATSPNLRMMTCRDATTRHSSTRQDIYIHLSTPVSSARRGHPPTSVHHPKAGSALPDPVAAPARLPSPLARSLQPPPISLSTAPHLHHTTPPPACAAHGPLH
ncbi:uncharacterized protein K460DRAFT_37028 [Cucurbitaria berberidis CBS 394.84]|uniref:Uncharacterized protein n=1 Tax=Cucurbitaria berberidis CBS 394.84 TaxID=1168544 RepID=A0A9P4GRU4_9PLEO|nr:uncharacterized protein K460DRAFT_37028 [Cucurbitaria berberidis CBS 394.84]KAF1851553.1 hypothetical protein K460DRAFT_37028 [Cucurbitaria berberidis CBS 394.84]